MSTNQDPSLQRAVGEASFLHSQALAGSHVEQDDAYDWQLSELAEAFRKNGGLSMATEVGLMLQDDDSNLTSHVDRWILDQEIVSFTWLRRRWIPMFQFDDSMCVKYEVKVLLDELRNVFDDIEIATWMVTENNYLDGTSPIQAMKVNFGSVRDAARVDRFIAG